METDTYSCIHTHTQTHTHIHKYGCRASRCTSSITSDSQCIPDTHNTHKYIYIIYSHTHTHTYVMYKTTYLGLHGVRAQSPQTPRKRVTKLHPLHELTICFKPHIYVCRASRCTSSTPRTRATRRRCRRSSAPSSTTAASTSVCIHVSIYLCVYIYYVIGFVVVICLPCPHANVCVYVIHTCTHTQ